MDNVAKVLTLFIVFVCMISSCSRGINGNDKDYVYYEVGLKSNPPDWRDTAFVVRTNNSQLIHELDAQLALPVTGRKLVVGALAPGNGTFNKNASHEFKWHFKEDDWALAEVTIEIYDGRPYTDVDLNLDYWLNTVKRYGAWSSYIRKKLSGKPQ